MLLLHIGDHSGRTLGALAAHILEPDHLLFAATAVLICVWVCRQGRRIEARAHLTRGRRT